MADPIDSVTLNPGVGGAKIATEAIPDTVATTTIAAASDAQSLPQATVNVASTTNFPVSGLALVATSTGLQSVTYTGVTPTSLTGCTGGTGVMSLGGAVSTAALAEIVKILVGGDGINAGFVSKTNPLPVTLYDAYGRAIVSDELTRIRRMAERAELSLEDVVQDGRVGVDVLSWAGSEAPTLGQKTAAKSIPVVIATEENAVLDTLNSHDAGDLSAFDGGWVDTRGYEAVQIGLAIEANNFGLAAIYFYYEFSEIPGSSPIFVPENLGLVGNPVIPAIYPYIAVTNSFFRTITPPARYMRLHVGVSPLNYTLRVYLLKKARGIQQTVSQQFDGIGQAYEFLSPVASETTLSLLSKQLPAALVGGRLDTNNGAWLGSTAPTVGQKVMASSLPVVLASDQSGQNVMASSIPVVIASDQAPFPVSVNGSTASSFDSVGGGWIVSGCTTAIVAAAKAANTMLMSARASTGNHIYITRLKLTYQVVTAFAAAAVPSTLAWQRFTAQTPTGGTARTPCRKNITTGSATNLTDVRDSNAALTGSAPTFGDVIAQSLMPTFTVSGSIFVWDVDLTKPNSEPILLDANDGIALRTGPTNAFAATGTWMYSYEIHWFERA